METKIFSGPCLVKFLFNLRNSSDHRKVFTIWSNYLPSLIESFSMSSIVCEVTKQSLCSKWLNSAF